VVVEPRSPSKSNSNVPCWKCGAPQTFPDCEKCGALQPVPEDYPYFKLFGLQPTLITNHDFLRAKFYDLSKKVHPDKFTQSKGPDALYSSRWSSLLNKAYQTLKDRERTALYLLGHEINAKSVPTELAETYFDLQDALHEAGGKEKLKAFQENLKSQLAECEGGWDVLNQRWLETQDGSLIEKHLTRERYLRSMLADIEKKS